MTVIVLTWELHIPGCRSLKEKRTVVRSIRDRLRNRFNVSVSETGLQDVHDRCELTAAFVTSDGRTAESLAGKLERFVDENGRALVIRRTREER
ncbi:MAG: DUF503 domain-containing protein [Gemmatimonadales bacterium]|nr:MAG: DUF503 domain-containing protein [Gemmatimonadales bacterium]